MFDSCDSRNLKVGMSFIFFSTRDLNFSLELNKNNNFLCSILVIHEIYK
jgi:hypothetical protein